MEEGPTVPGQSRLLLGRLGSPSDVVAAKTVSRGTGLAFVVECTEYLRTRGGSVMRTVARVLAVLALAAAGIGLSAAPVSAAQINVTTTDDELNADGDCSLREALVAASTNTATDACPAGSGVDVDVVSIPAGAYTLTIAPDGTPDDGEDGDFDLFGDLNIKGAGARRTIIDADHIDRVFQILATSTVRISDVTIRNGETADVNGAGAVRNIASNLTLRRVTIANSHATAGNAGAISNGNATSLLTIIDSTLKGNSTVNGGGAIWNANGATANLRNVTLSGNSADESGGGVENQPASTMTIVSSTISGNTADADDNGGGAGGGIADTGGALSLRNTIVAGNDDPVPASDPDCFGNVASMGYNLIGNVSANCLFAVAATDQTNSAPKLKALANNGGPTNTHALKAGSPARNQIPKGSAPNKDQRGAPRVGKADIGAYEFVKCRGVVVNRVGTSGPDVLRGTVGRDGFLGLRGADTVRAKGGNDAACGGKGYDGLIGGPGNDRLDGDQGNDILNGAGGKDILVGDAGNDQLFGGPANDKLNGGAGRDFCRQNRGVGPVLNCEVPR